MSLLLSERSDEMTFSASEQFDPHEMQAFMRRPEIYWATQDSLADPPERVDFASFLRMPSVHTVAALWSGSIVGYVQLVQRTSIGAEMNVGFHPQARGMVAKRFTEYALAKAAQRGLRKVWALIPSDNRPAVMAAVVMHFRQEGRLSEAIVRDGGLRDILVYTLELGATGSAH